MKNYAVHQSRGRLYPHHPEDTSSIRGDFRWDRAKILYSRAWRRMKGKTQVYPSNYGDHYRNRMTHSLEVSSLSRDMAFLLGLNEDLAECIALAHDLGHTPFGHAGEEALHECLLEDGLFFEHNEHSFRIVHEIEKAYPDIPGLNLCEEILDGIRKHESAWDNPKNTDPIRPSLEAQIVNFADEITYQAHDCDDGLRSGLLSWEDIQSVDLWQKALTQCQIFYPHEKDTTILRQRSVSILIQILLQDFIQQSEKNIRDMNIQSLEDVYACTKPILAFSPEIANQNRLLKQYLLKNFYHHPHVLDASHKGQVMIQKLYKKLRPQFENKADLRDYIAGMTEDYAQSILVDM